MLLSKVQNDVAQEVSRDLAHLGRKELKHLAYTGLSEEVGEVSGIHKREIRNFDKDRARCTREHKVEELGDTLWYLAMVCIVEGITLDELWEYNRKKLEERYG